MAKRKMNRESRSGYLTRGSLTAEAAMLMPLVFFTVFMALYLAFHVHIRTVLSSGAGEQAISGHEQETPSLMAAAGITASFADGSSRRTVRYTGGTAWYTGTVLWSTDVSRTYRKYRPVKLLRKAAAVRRGRGDE